VQKLEHVDSQLCGKREPPSTFSLLVISSMFYILPRPPPLRQAAIPQSAPVSRSFVVRPTTGVIMRCNQISTKLSLDCVGLPAQLARIRPATIRCISLLYASQISGVVLRAMKVV